MSSRATAMRGGISKTLAPWAFALAAFAAGAQGAAGSGSGINENYWTGEYFNNVELYGEPDFVRNDGNGYLDFAWGAESPSKKIHPDGFSARWSRTVDFPADGIYVFKAEYDDAMRIYLDEENVFDHWLDSGGGSASFLLYVRAGRRRLAAEHFESESSAKARLSWEAYKEPAGRTATISGSILPPEGEAAPPAGLRLIVRATSDDKAQYACLAVLPAGAASAAYSIAVPAGPKDLRYVVDYVDLGGTYSGSAFSLNKTVMEAKGEVVALAGKGDARGADLRPRRGVAISGALSLPPGRTALPGGVKATVKAKDAFYNQFTDFVVIPEGASRAPYSIEIPFSDRFKKFAVGFSGAFQGCLSSGFYNVSSKSTSQYSFGDDWINLAGGGVEGVDMEYLPLRRMSGRISLAGGATAPPGGLEVRLRALDRIKLGSSATPGTVVSRIFAIPYGKGSVDFALDVPVSARANAYILKFFVLGGGYARNGYYSPGKSMGSYAAFDDLAWLDLSARDAPGLSLELSPNPASLPWDEERRAQERAAEEEMDRVAGLLSRPGLTDFEKLIAAHDYVVLNARYGLYMDEYCSVYTNLVQKIGQCGTYAGALAGLLKRAGVEALVASGSTGNNGHAWTLLKIRDRYYQVDPTFDDSSKDFGYGYFLLSQDQAEERGYRWNRVKYPAYPEPFAFEAGDYVHKKELRAAGYRRVMGTVRLPEGEKAPPGGIGLTIRGSKAFIPEGRSSAFYALAVPLAGTADRLILEFRADSEDYVSKFYYSSKGAVTDPAKASPLDLGGDDLTGIDVTLTRGSSISGTVRVPDSVAVPLDGLKCKVRAAGEGNEVYEKSLVVPYGKKSAPYAISLPEGKAQSYRLSCVSDSSYDFYCLGYYSRSGPTGDAKKADALSLANGDLDNVDLLLLKGAMIHGTMGAPAPGAIAEEGLKTWIYVKEESGAYSSGSSLTFKKGEKSRNFTLRVPAINERMRFYVYYQDGGADYADRAYYSDGGMRGDEKDATPLDLSRGDRKDLKLSFVPALSVSGTLSLPAGERAPAGGIASSILLQDPQTGKTAFSKKISIAEGQSSAEWKINLPPEARGRSYLLLYDGGQTLYYFMGYYAGKATTTEKKGAAAVEIGAKGASGLGLALIKGVRVSGSVRLPPGRSAPKGGLAFRLIYYLVDEKGGWVSSGRSMSIKEGEERVDYAYVFVDRTKKYRISYVCEDPSYVREGYYSAAGTRSSRAAGDLIDIGLGDRSGVDLLIGQGVSLSGRLSLPAGMKAPAGGLSVPLRIRGDAGYDQTYRIEVPENQSQADFLARVPDDVEKSFTLCCLGTTGELEPESYYAAAKGMARTRAEAAALDLSKGNLSGIALAPLRGSPFAEAVPAGSWKGEYFNNKDLKSTPSVVRNDGSDILDFNWKKGRPDERVLEDDFSARWTREAAFEKGDYAFYLAADDRARLYVDGELLIDDWAKTQDYVAFRRMGSGSAGLQVEYYEALDSARIRFFWTRLSMDPAKAVPPGSMRLLKAPSGSGSNGPEKALDGNGSTWWQTDSKDKSIEYPYELVIDLGSVLPLKGFAYLPRIDPGGGGAILDYELYAGASADDFGKPLLASSFPPEKALIEKAFPPVKARYVKFRALSGQAKTKDAAIAELYFYRE